jgi:hypothetical protein
MNDDSVLIHSYRRFTNAFIVQLFRDYERGGQVDKQSIYWFIKRKGKLFNVCAILWDMSPEQFEVLTISILKKIDRGELKLSDAQKLSQQLFNN